MEPIVFLAQFWGWFMVLGGVMMLLGKSAFANELEELVKDRGFVMMVGFFALTLGLMSVILYRTWSMDWAGVVTFIGWLAIVGGLVRIMLPGLVKSAASWLATNSWVLYVMAGACLVVGIGLLRFVA